MNEHYRCEPLSDREIIDSARMLRRANGIGESSCPDIVSILQRKTIPTRRGEKTFHYWPCPDEELEEGALTSITPASIELVISKSICSNARFGHGRARMVIAQQLGHAVLHENVVPGSAEAGGPRALASEPARQANIFALHYLVSEAAVYAAASVEDLAETCLVPLDAAQRLWTEARGRDEQIPYIEADRRLDTCTTCGRPTMLEAGQKFYCLGCVRMADAYPDGDGPF